MALRMASLGRDRRSGSWKARKAIPVALRGAYARAYGRGWEEKFVAPASHSEAQARAAFAEWLSDIEARLSLISALARGEGADLTHKQAHALAGRWYRWKVEAHSEEPGRAALWVEEIAGFLASIYPPEADAGPLFASAQPSASAHLGDLIEQAGDAQQELFDRVAEHARADAFLVGAHLALSHAGRKAFLAALLQEVVAANALLYRRAEGDYAPDPRPARFPEWLSPKPAAVGEGMSALALYSAWAKANETRTSPSTRSRWITVFRHMDAYFKQGDVLRITEEHAVAWRENVRAGDGEGATRSDKTVNFQYIAAAKAVFGWAARPKTEDGGALIEASPFAKFKLSARKGARKTVKLRERSFRLAEMLLVLPAAQAVSVTPASNRFAKAKRWTPWLLAYTGSRPGEVCQLRKEDLRLVQGRWALRLTPEAGTIKDREARIIPVHQHLIEMGLVDFIRAETDGPLFYDTKALRRTDLDDPANPRRFPHEKVAHKLAGWVRGLGVTDPDIKPNHAWRHTFKTRAIVNKIDSVVADFICGHAPKTVGDSYYALEGDEGWPALVGAIDAFPRYAV